MPRALREVAILHRETGTVPILFGTIVASTLPKPGYNPSSLRDLAGPEIRG